jgi:hypothetical protein
VVSDVDADKLDQVLRDGRLIVWTICLAALLILGVWGIIWVRRWGQHDKQTFLSAAEEIAAFRRLLEQGLLTQEEFDRVRARLEQSNGVPADPLAAHPEGGHPPPMPDETATPPASIPGPIVSPEPPASEPRSERLANG